MAKERIALKASYKIKLYHSPLFKMIVGAALLITIAYIVFLGYTVFSHFSSGGTFYEFFFPESDLFHLEFPIGVRNIIDFVIAAVLSVLWAHILFRDTFFNKIVVYDEYIKIHYAPRLYNRYILKENIRAFVPVKSEELTLTQRLLNLSFSRSDLYKIVCYNKEFIVACKDKERLAQLQREIDAARANKTDEEISDGNKISDWVLMYTIFIAIAFALDYIRTLITI